MLARHARVIRPLKDKILVRRLEGHGIEAVSKGGIILPATREKSVRTKGDYFRARVEAMGPDAQRAMPDLEPGEEVYVYTYSGTSESVFTGVDTPYGTVVRVGDIVDRAHAGMEAAHQQVER